VAHRLARVAAQAVLTAVGNRADVGLLHDDSDSWPIRPKLGVCIRQIGKRTQALHRWPALVLIALFVCISEQFAFVEGSFPGPPSPCSRQTASVRVAQKLQLVMPMPCSPEITPSATASAMRTTAPWRFATCQSSLFTGKLVRTLLPACMCSAAQTRP
jgi:hypothetical protein